MIEISRNIETPFPREGMKLLLWLLCSIQFERSLKLRTTHSRYIHGKNRRHIRNASKIKWTRTYRPGRVLVGRSGSRLSNGRKNPTASRTGASPTHGARASRCMTHFPSFPHQKKGPTGAQAVRQTESTMVIERFFLRQSTHLMVTS